MRQVKTVEIRGRVGSAMTSQGLPDFMKGRVRLSAAVACAVDSWATALLGPRCPDCGKRSLGSLRDYTRGWNNLCEQADSAPGHWCSACEAVKFEETEQVWFERMRRTAPWVTPRRDAAMVECLKNGGDVFALAATRAPVCENDGVVS